MADTDGTMMSTSEEAPALSCGICLQPLQYMEGPLILPCKDVFCLECIQEDYDYYKEVVCRVCSQRYPDISRNNLKRYSYTGRLDGETEPIIPALGCDGKDCEQEASVFCSKLECEKKLCTTHLQHHDDLTNDAHKDSLISITAYKASPLRYQPVKCPDHPKETLKYACCQCHKTFCCQCDQKTKCSPSNESRWEYWKPEKLLTKAKSAFFAYFDNTMHHQLRDINELAEEIKTLYTGKILKTVAHQIQEVCKEEKQAWNELYEDEDWRENLLTEVDKWAEREIETKVKQIKEHAEEKKRELHRYGQVQEKRFSEFGTDMRERGDGLRTLLRDTNRIMEMENNLTILRDHPARAAHIEKLTDHPIRKPDRLKQAKLLYNEGAFGLEVQTGMPKLNFVKSIPGFTKVTALAMTNSRALIGLGQWQTNRHDTGRFRQVKQIRFDADMKDVCNKDITVQDDIGAIAGIARNKDVFLVLSKDGSRLKLASYQASTFNNLSSSYESFTYWNLNPKYPSRRLEKSMVSDQHMAVMSDNSGKITQVLVLYKTDGKYNMKAFSDTDKNIHTIKLPDITKPAGLCAVDEDYILISNCIQGGSVTKYRINDQGRQESCLEEVWTCENMTLPGSIRKDHRGNYLIASWSQPAKIYMISPQGELITELQLTNISADASIQDMCVHQDNLILALEERGVKHYKLTYYK